MSDRVTKLLAKANRHIKDGKSEPARKALRQAHKIAPANVQVLNELAALEFHAGNAKGAIPVLRKLSQLRSDEPGIGLRLAEVLEDTGDLDGAEELLRKLTIAHPDFSGAHNGLGNVLQVRRQFEEAVVSYARALELQANEAAIWNNAGNALDELDRHAEAAEHYSKAIEIDDGNAEFYYYRARARTALDQPEQALSDVAQCLALDPADQKGLALQGVLFSALGRHDEERRLFDYDRFVQTFRPEPPAGFETIEAFNAAAISHIRNRVPLEYDPEGVSTRGGWHSKNLLMDPHKSMTALRSMLQNVFETFVSQLPDEPDHPFPGRARTQVRLVAQAQVLESQGYLLSHIHPGGWISSAYYLSVPEVVSQDESKSGWLEFGRPTADIKMDVDLEVRAVKPEPGMAVLFPSYFFHGTRPFESAEPRISLGVDLVPMG